LLRALNSQKIAAVPNDNAITFKLSGFLNFKFAIKFDNLDFNQLVIIWFCSLREKLMTSQKLPLFPSRRYLKLMLPHP
jgi:hypothetical protein